MNVKRQLLIDTALTLFYQNGINSIGINEVLKVSGVAKKTLYTHFDSKEDLILATLEQRHSVFIGWLNQKLQGANSNEEVVVKLFTALESWFDGVDKDLGKFRGCYFINSAAEFSENNNKIFLLCQRHKREVKQVICLAMIKENFLLLNAICIMKEGAITTAHVTRDQNSIENCILMLQKLM
jgi:AcrR family transcriptional regulator